jgi:hypothetical protein
MKITFIFPLIYRTNIEKASPSKNPANNTIGEIE